MNIETELSRELWQAVRRSYESQAWANAILDSIHFLSDILRAKTDLQSDGVALVGQALGGKSPKLRLNRRETDSEKNIQAGVEQLLRGLYQAVRNPRSHDTVDDTQADADAIVLFVDYLLRVLGHARASFSIDECVGRIIEENFVPSKRYANLLVAEIPPRHRLQVALTVFQRKTTSDGRKLRVFFDAVFDTLPEEQQTELLSAFASELRENSDEGTLRCFIQLLNEAIWPRIDEVARLRTENRIIRNLQEGRYDANTKKCTGGALATWTHRFWPFFLLKSQVLYTLTEKLRSASVESQDYVLEYLFEYLDHLADAPPHTLQAVLVERLKAGDIRFKRAIDGAYLWKDEKWNDSFTQAMTSFQSLDPTITEDDIPF